MAIDINDVQAIMPMIALKVGQKIGEAIALPDRAAGYFRKGTPRETNAKGAREYIEIQENNQVGSTGEDGVFLEGGGYRYIELLIGANTIHISGKVTGSQIRNLPSVKAAGLSVAKLMMKDARVARNWDNINVCRGDGVWSHGTIVSISVSGGKTTVTFDSVNGSFYVKVGANYFVHHPTTIALKGGGVTFKCLSKPSKTTAVFEGDMSAGTTAAANDILVPKATADGQSAINRAARGFAYWAATSGDYFGADRDTIDLIRGLRVNGGTDMVSHPLLEQGNSVHYFRNGDENSDTSSFTDFISPTQREAYLLNAYGARRLDTEAYQNYDGAAKMRGDGGRRTIVDKYLPDTTWDRLKAEAVRRFVLQEMAVWDLDGKKFRTIPANNSTRDSIMWTMHGEHNYAGLEPWNHIQFFALGTSGVTTKTT